METKKESGNKLEPKEEKEENNNCRHFFARLDGLFFKKYFAWIAVAALIIFFVTSYLLVHFGKIDNKSFVGKILKPFFAERLPFFEKQAFFFPPKNGESITGKKNILEEASRMGKSSSPDWWLNSGGIMNIEPEEFSTNIGALAKDSRWRKLYSKTSPKDTNEGYFPQNIFRLVIRSKWKNFSQAVYFKIENSNLSQSENRNESNGVLLFNRYQDGDNLYYAGIRVDGHAVIKKKIKDKYYTLKEKKFFTLGDGYDRENNPNLIPSGTWLGIKSEVKNIDNNTVEIKFYIDKNQKGDWQLILETKDSTGKKGETPFLREGYAGIRTDFMDVRFRDYGIQRL